MRSTVCQGKCAFAKQEVDKLPALIFTLWEYHKCLLIRLTENTRGNNWLIDCTGGFSESVGRQGKTETLTMFRSAFCVHLTPRAVRMKWGNWGNWARLKWRWQRGNHLLLMIHRTLDRAAPSAHTNASASFSSGSNLIIFFPLNLLSSLLSLRGLLQEKVGQGTPASQSCIRQI